MNDINTLRSHLFNALEAVKNGSISVEQAKAVSDIGQTIINSAKLEVDYCKATDSAVFSSFIEADNDSKKALPNGIVSIRTYKLKG